MNASDPKPIRCLNPQCGHILAGSVVYCPYCGFHKEKVDPALTLQRKPEPKSDTAAESKAAPITKPRPEHEAEASPEPEAKQQPVPERDLEPKSDHSPDPPPPPPPPPPRPLWVVFAAVGLVAIAIGGYIIMSGKAPLGPDVGGRGELAAVPISVNEHIRSMLANAESVEGPAFRSALEALKAVSSPPHGNRKAAKDCNSKGLAATKAGKYGEAVADFECAHKADPADIEVANNLGYALLMEGRTEEAAGALAKTIAMKPERTSAWANLGQVLAKQGREVDSAKAFLISYRFSTNATKTLEFLSKLVDEDPDSRVRNAAAVALTRLLPDRTLPTSTQVREQSPQLPQPVTGAPSTTGTIDNSGTRPPSLAKPGENLPVRPPTHEQLDLEEPGLASRAGAKKALGVGSASDRQKSDRPVAIGKESERKSSEGLDLEGGGLK